MSWCFKKIVLLAPYVCFHSFSKVKITEWPPIGKIAAHSAYHMFHGIQYSQRDVYILHAYERGISHVT